MKKHFTITLSVISILCLILISLTINWHQNKLQTKLTSDIYTRLGELSESNTSNIMLKINDQFDMLGLLSDYISSDDLQSENVLKLLNDAVYTYKFLRCAITFPDGSFITHDKKTIGYDTDDSFLKKTLKGISTVSGPQTAVADPSKTVILLSVPIYVNGTVKAVLSGTYETIRLNETFKLTNYDGAGYSYITGSDGLIIANSDNEEWNYNGTNFLEFISGQGDSDLDTQIILNNVKQMKKGGFLLSGVNPKYVSYQPIGINDWYIFSVVSANILDTQINSVMNDVYLLFFVVICIFIGFILCVSYGFKILRNKSHQELAEIAYYDKLTHLANQHLFEKETRRILDNTTGKYAYIILDINKFKLVNEMFGFANGDLLLKHIASIIADEANKNELCARFYADSFHILSLFDSKESLERRLIKIAEEISDYKVDSNRIYQLSVAFGVYIIDDPKMSVNLMGDKAKMALSKIKGLHSANVYFYDTKINNQIVLEQEIENTMQKALNNGELTLYLQPKNSTENLAIIGAEALVRWVHPIKGIIPPDSFIPIFERNGFIIKLDLYMFECTCKKIKEWQNKGMPIVPISVNQSRLCLYHATYIEELTAILNKYNVSPVLIELEIIESAFFEDTDVLISVIEKLHNLGFLVAMDDFGSGYSSLNMLQDVDVDVLKLDKNFFKESINSTRGKKIVSTIVSMSNDLKIDVVAEGIETKEQLAFLQSIHCGIAQGFYFSKPITTKAFEELLMQDFQLQNK